MKESTAERIVFWGGLLAIAILAAGAYGLSEEGSGYYAKYAGLERETVQVLSFVVASIGGAAGMTAAYGEKMLIRMLTGK